MTAELHQEEFVCGIGVPQECVHGFVRLVHTEFHAIAGIEDNADRGRRVLGREVRDHLLHFVFEECEVLLLQARHNPAVAIGDSYRDLYQIRVHQNGGDPGVCFSRGRPGLVLWFAAYRRAKG